MSKPRYDWWTYVKGMIRRYPELKRHYEVFFKSGASFQATDITKGGEILKPIKIATLKRLSKINWKEYDAVSRAIEDTRQYENGGERLKVVDLVFWKKSCTLTGAAMQVPCSKRTAQEWHRQFIRLVADKYGFFE